MVLPVIHLEGKVLHPLKSSFLMDATLLTTQRTTHHLGIRGKGSNVVTFEPYPVKVIDGFA